MNFTTDLDDSLQGQSRRKHDQYLELRGSNLGINFIRLPVLFNFMLSTLLVLLERLVHEGKHNR